jgi:hypothetical protein
MFKYLSIEGKIPHSGIRQILGVLISNLFCRVPVDYRIPYKIITDRV